jgi:Glycine zipper 2TM domain
MFRERSNESIYYPFHRMHRQIFNHSPPHRKEAYMSVLVKKTVASLAIASFALASATPAMARHHNNGGYYQNYDRGYDNGYYRNSGYDDRDYGYRRDRNYRGSRCDKGTGGLIIGAVAGGLLGRAVVGRRGDRTAGTILGAGAGALAGRALDRSDSRNRC